MFKSYRDLGVWQEAMRLVEAVYAVTARFPTEERYGLTAQLRRSTVSVASNITEGHARSGTRDFLRFLDISLGSLAETETQLEIARRLGSVEETVIQRLTNDSNRLGRMLRGLKKSLATKLPAASSP